ncbi:MAG: YgiQ family radical SAM protein [Candidatus Cloacimonadaceae bacterium]|nr:YgiQ family radical SAM protein [Candidatus Cloacimonadaceae bacterium]
MPFLPASADEMKSLGWTSVDIILISGDAYVDHPGFGTAIIGRVLEAAGYKVGIIAQPDWRKDEDFLCLGVPRLFFGVSAGNMDSMVNHYTAQRKLRHNDAYSPDGKSGMRPDRATMIYTNILKRLFKTTPIVLGGIEASLRRIAHYNFWQDKIRNSILSDSKADLIVYGMGESAILEIAAALDKGKSANDIDSVPGTVVMQNQAPQQDDSEDSMILPDADHCKDKETFHQMTKLFFKHHQSRVLYQKNGGRWIKHNPPAKPLETNDLDRIYALPFEYAPHPRYKGLSIPAFEQIKDSITSHRGCYGGCNFCAISCHQGRAVQSRSSGSIISESLRLIRRKRSGKTTISDLGGPTANMYASSCKLKFPPSCKRLSCVYPGVCANLMMDHDAQLRLLAEVEAQDGIGHVFIASGIRHDLAVNSKAYISAIATKYTGGRLKLAPEHCVPKVLRLMGKPVIESYETFSKEFFAACNQAGLKRQIVPYIIIGHPGTTIQDAIELRKWLIKNTIRIEQVQEFTPTPMTISTCMYFTGMDFETGAPIEIPKPSEVRKQKELALWHLSDASSPFHAKAKKLTH